MQMCLEEDYSTVVEKLAIDDKVRVGIEETKNHGGLSRILAQWVLH